MPEKRTNLFAAVLMTGTNIGAILALQWRTFAADIMAVRLQKQ